MIQDDHFENASIDQEEEEEYRPWYKDQTTPPPFQLLDRDDAPSFHSVAIFPWDNDSSSTLWQGSLRTIEDLEQWKKMISDYWDAVAVGSEYNLYVFFTNKKKAPLCVKLSQDGQKLLSTDKMCVAWGLATDFPFEPLVIFSRGSFVHIYNVVRLGTCGYLRGHGGAITSISVHPTTPQLFCTTSRDFTTRIYDLSLLASYSNDLVDTGKKKKSKTEQVPNPPWPPGKNPSLAGAAHGLRLPLSELEGNGRGRCVAVLLGGRSAGHQAAVLGSAFHPVFPLIATCGLDRTVKIWPVRPKSPLEIKREDKPLFSSSMVHKARVLSISWLQHDVLLTHSAPAITRLSPDSKQDKRTYVEPGELVIWRWIGLDRFFPAEFEQNPMALGTLRGCSSDYQESSSFKIISIHAFPAVPTQYIAPNLSLFQSPIHDPLILYVYPPEKETQEKETQEYSICKNSICMLNAAHMKPREQPAFPREVEKLLGNPQDASGAALADAAGRLHLDLREEEEEEEEGEEGEGVDEPFILRRPAVVPPGIDYRRIDIHEEDPEKKLISCAMGMGGRVVVGVGSKGSLWVWRYDD